MLQPVDLWLPDLHLELFIIRQGQVTGASYHFSIMGGPWASTIKQALLGSCSLNIIDSRAGAREGGGLAAGLSGLTAPSGGKDVCIHLFARCLKRSCVDLCHVSVCITW